MASVADRVKALEVRYFRLNQVFLIDGTDGDEERVAEGMRRHFGAAGIAPPGARVFVLKWAESTPAYWAEAERKGGSVVGC